jgi:hypothetical protein
MDWRLGLAATGGATGAVLQALSATTETMAPASCAARPKESTVVMLTSDFDINKPIFKKQFCNWAPRYQKSIIDDVQLNSTVRGVDFGVR